MSELGIGIGSVFNSAGADLDPYWRRVQGNEAVAQAIARRLLTPAGSLAWAPEVGFDVRDLVNESLTEAKLREIERDITAEILGDERVRGARVTVVFLEASRSLSADCSFTTAAGPFRFVLAVSQAAGVVFSKG